MHLVGEMIVGRIHYRKRHSRSSADARACVITCQFPSGEKLSRRPDVDMMSANSHAVDAMCVVASEGGVMDPVFLPSVDVKRSRAAVGMSWDSYTQQ